jgi:hypothetical protein
MTKDEALKMAIEAISILKPDNWVDKVLQGKAYSACNEALEQPTQEPVAWMSEEVLPLNHIIKAVVRREPDEQYTIPLYTHPPKEWQGLSDDEIDHISMHSIVGSFNTRLFARAIESKLKEKNT